MTVCDTRRLEHLVFMGHPFRYSERVREMLVGSVHIDKVLKVPCDDKFTIVSKLDISELRTDGKWWDTITRKKEEELSTRHELEEFDVSAGAAIACGPALVICSKCKGTRVSYYQQQTRSSDEGMTTFFQCQSDICGKRWRN